MKLKKEIVIRNDKGILREKSKKDKFKRDKFSQLRAMAEAALENRLPPGRGPDPDELSCREIREMVHELNVYQVELETQNDELIKLQYDLEAERNKYYDLYDLAPIGYFTTDRQGRVTEINLTGAALLGLERGAVKGKAFHDFISFDSQDIFFLKLRKILKTKVQQAFELKIKKADNTEFHAQLECRPVCDLEGNVTHIRGVIEDVNKIKLVEAKLEASLKEKELLLKEIHHRVKNNLALVCSLLYLQAQAANHPTVDRVFASCKNRIKSIALVHEILYESDDLTKIDFSHYIKELVNYLSSLYAGGETDLTLETRISNIKMPINQAIPCGLIINELTTNAFKYAFTGDKTMKIHIEIGIIDDKSCQLLISDNGVGLPPNLDLENTKTFGLTLVNLLIQQLKGSYEVDRRGGTTFKITFPIP